MMIQQEYLNEVPGPLLGYSPGRYHHVLPRKGTERVMDPSYHL
jgi:hypothetical protein